MAGWWLPGLVAWLSTQEYFLPGLWIFNACRATQCNTFRYSTGSYRLRNRQAHATTTYFNRFAKKTCASYCSQVDNFSICTTYGNRTRHSSVKGRRLNRLTNAAFPIRSAKVKPFFEKKYNFNNNSEKNAQLPAAHYPHQPTTNRQTLLLQKFPVHLTISGTKHQHIRSGQQISAANQSGLGDAVT